MLDFLRDDFERLTAGPGTALLARCAALDGQRLFLSGGSGFFGLNLLALLAWLHERGLRFEVSALAREPARWLAAHPRLARQPWLTLHTGEMIAPWPDAGGHDLLLHAATYVPPPGVARPDPSVLFAHNVAGMRQALAFAQAQGVRRFLHTSSGAVYGAGAMRGPQPIEESAHTLHGSASSASGDVAQLHDSQHAYGASKCVAEGLAQTVAEKLAHQNAPACTLAVVHARCFAFVGPGLPMQGNFAIGNFIADALAGRAPTLQSAGTSQRSYLYSADLAVWLLLLLLEAQPGKRPQVVNVGSDQGHSVLQLAELVRDQFLPGVPVTPGAAGHEPRPHYVPSIARAQVQGLAVWTRLDHAIARTALWHQRQAPTS